MEFDDEDAFARFRDNLVGRFEAAHPDLGWVADQVLTFKLHLDSDPMRWREQDVHELLLEVVPRKVVLAPADHQDYLAGMAALLRWLDAQSLWEGPADAEALARVVEASAARFDTAMADRSRWGLGKTMMSGAGNLDPSDPQQLQAAMDAFNALPYAQRSAATGPFRVLPPFPPVVLAPPAELEAAARASVWPGRVEAFRTYVGAGRPLTATGQLRLADARELVALLGTDDVMDPVIGSRTFKTKSAAELPGVDLTRALAKAAGYVKVRAGKLSATKTKHGDVLTTWRALLDALLHEVGPVQHDWRGEDAYDFGWYAEDLDDQLVPLLLELYREQAPVELADLAARCWEELVDLMDWRTDEQRNFHRGGAQASLLRALRRLEEFGVLELHDASQDDGDLQGTVRLTPLGTWAMHPVAADLAEAPVVGALAGLDATELLRRAADLPEGVARGEVDHWLTLHGPELLVDALPTADEAGRGLAFNALLRLGTPAAGAVDRLRTHPELGAYALVWRVDSLTAEADEMVQNTPEQWVRVLCAALELRGPHAVTVWAGAAAGAPGALALVEQAWRVRLPQTGAVLDALGSMHPDKAVAKAARKAAFKLRSAG